MDNDNVAVQAKSKPWYLKGDRGALIVLGVAAVLAVLILIFVFVLPPGHSGNAALFLSDLNKTSQIVNASIVFFTPYGQNLGIIFNANGTRILSAGANNFNNNLTQINSYYSVNGITMDCLYTYPNNFPNLTSGKICIKWPKQTLDLMRAELYPTSIADIFNPGQQANASQGSAYYDSLLGNLSYSGVKNVSGRLCDLFGYSNPGANTPVSINLCLDKQYGIADGYNNTLLGNVGIQLGGFRVNNPENVTAPRIGVYVSNVTCSANGLMVSLIPLQDITGNTTLRTTLREGNSTVNYVTENATTVINTALIAWKTYNVSVNPGHEINVSQESLRQIGGIGFCVGSYCENGDMFESSCS